MAISDHYKAAHEYANAPTIDPAAIRHWTILAREVGRLYQWVARQGLSLEKFEGNPYETFADLCEDVKRGRLQRTIDEDPHPVWDFETQWRFRTFHDYCHAISGHDFTIEGELAVCKQHIKLVDPSAWPAIVSEIYGQAAYSLVFGEYAKPKVFLSSIKP